MLMSATIDSVLTRSYDAAHDTQPIWSSLQKVSFRFLFCYMTLFSVDLLSFDNAFWIHGFTGQYWLPWAQAWGIVVSWLARSIFHLHAFTFQAATSGDSLSDYLLPFTYALVALVATLVWSLIDRRATNYSRLNQW